MPARKSTKKPAKRTKGAKQRAASAPKPIKKVARKKRPTGADQPLTHLQEAFAENYLGNGFNAVQAARDAGYTGSDATLRSIASENLTKPNISSRVRARLDGLKANADEVLFLLADHLRSDLADFEGCFKDDGRLDLVKAQERGVSRLVRKIKNTTRTISQGEGMEPIREVTCEIELYSAQDAAGKLIPVLGLKQRPKDNEADIERRQRWAEEKLRDVMNRLSMDRPAALTWLRKNAPQAAEWIN